MVAVGDLFQVEDVDDHHQDQKQERWSDKDEKAASASDPGFPTHRELLSLGGLFVGFSPLLDFKPLALYLKSFVVTHRTSTYSQGGEPVFVVSCFCS